MIPTIQLLKLLAAIAVVESNGNNTAIGDGGKAFGKYQIHKCVVEDVNKYTNRKFIHLDAYDPVAAEYIALQYLRQYTNPYLVYTDVAGVVQLREATLEDAARIYNGGPDGWKQNCTKKYWQRVKREMAKQEKSARVARLIDSHRFCLP